LARVIGANCKEAVFDSGLPIGFKINISSKPTVVFSGFDMTTKEPAIKLEKQLFFSPHVRPFPTEKTVIS